MRFDPKAFFAKPGSGRSVRQYPSREVIFAQGGAADSAFYILEGKVKLAVVSSRGREAVIAIAEAGQFFGESCLAIEQPLRMSSATSVEDSTIAQIKRDTLLGLLHDEEGLAEFFTSYLVSRTLRVEADLVDQLFNSSEKRLARALLLLAHFGKEGRSELIIPRVNQETLAQMVGTTRARVSTFMSKFRKLGLIDYNGGLRVNSSLFKVVLHD
jgi:CRP-like cAMP-binding protein